MFKTTFAVLVLGLCACASLVPSAFAAEADGPDAEPAPRLFPFRAGHWGYMDATGKTIVAPQFEYAYDFHDGPALAFSDRNEVREWSIVGFDGVSPIEEKYDHIRSFSEGLAWYCVSDKWGIIDGNGTVVLEPTFDDVNEFSEGLAAVNVGATWGDPFPYPIREGGKWGFVDAHGRVAIKPQYESVGDFSDGLARTRGGGVGSSFIRPDGEVAFQIEFDRGAGQFVGHVAQFHEGLAAFFTDGDRGTQVGFIDTENRLVIPTSFRGAGNFSEGLAWVLIDKKYGFIDREGEVAIEPRFDEAGDFSGGLTPVLVGEAWGYIDRRGQMAIEPDGSTLGPFNYAEGFQAGLARVHVGGSFEATLDGPAAWSGGAWHYIDRQGTVIRRCRRDDERGPGYGREFR